MLEGEWRREPELAKLLQNAENGLPLLKHLRAAAIHHMYEDVRLHHLFQRRLKALIFSGQQAQNLKWRVLYVCLRFADCLKHCAQGVFCR